VPMSYEELDTRGRDVVGHLQACAQFAEKVNGSDTAASLAQDVERLAVHWNSAVTLTVAVRDAVSPVTFKEWLRKHHIPLDTAQKLLGE